MLLNRLSPLVSDVGISDRKQFQMLQRLQGEYSIVRYLCIVQPQLFQVGELRQRLQTLIADVGLRKVEPLEGYQRRQLRKSIAHDARPGKIRQDSDR